MGAIIKKKKKNAKMTVVTSFLKRSRYLWQSFSSCLERVLYLLWNGTAFMCLKDIVEIRPLLPLPMLFILYMAVNPRFSKVNPCKTLFMLLLFLGSWSLTKHTQALNVKLTSKGFAKVCRQPYPPIIFFFTVCIIANSILYMFTSIYTVFLLAFSMWSQTTLF